VFGLTVAQLVVGVFVPGLERFEDKALPAFPGASWLPNAACELR